uniref:F-box domain-containing protein n=1 Tax=Parastrongyloides trichosuri TaxID=131310 RepID=A0A0N4Z3D2_PARTI
MSIINLPNEILIEIFSYLPFQNLNNVRSVSKQFYYIIENNFHKLNKPGMQNLSVSNVLKCGDKEIYYFCCSTESNISLRGYKIYIEKKNASLGYINFILKRFKTDNLLSIDLNIQKNEKLINTLNKYLTNGSKYRDVYVKIKNSHYSEELKRLLEKLSNVETLNINLLSIESLDNDIVIPDFDTIKNLRIQNLFDNNTFEKEFINKIIRDSPQLKELCILKKSFDNYANLIEVIDMIISREWNFNLCGPKYSNHVFEIYLNYNENLENEEKANFINNIYDHLMEYFENVFYDYSSEWKSLISASNTCSDCGKNKYLHIYFVKER